MASTSTRKPATDSPDNDNGVTAAHCLICDNVILKEDVGKFGPITPSATFTNLAEMLDLPEFHLSEIMNRKLLAHGLLILCSHCATVSSKYQGLLEQFQKLKKEIQLIKVMAKQKIQKSFENQKENTEIHIKEARQIICSSLKANKDTGILFWNRHSQARSSSTGSDTDDGNDGEFSTVNDSMTEPVGFDSERDYDLPVSSVQEDHPGTLNRSVADPAEETQPNSTTNSAVVVRKSRLLQSENGSIKRRRNNTRMTSGRLAQKVTPPKVITFSTRGRKKLFPCLDCGDVFNSKYLIRKHQGAHGNSFFCVYCKENLNSNDELRAHVKVHKETGHTCSTCLKTFASSHKLQAHRRYHESYFCCDCDKSVGTHYQLQVHKKFHEHKGGVQCSECLAIFKHQARLEKHYRKAHNNEVFCQDYNKTVRNTKQLLIHQKFHQETRGTQR